MAEMCDTLCSLPGNNSDPNVGLFGKNSDRDPNEIQVMEFYPRVSREGRVNATYIEVECEGDVNAILISRPLWMWGAEMGVNEKGVAIGNEAIFSNPKNKKKGLLGMDLLRLGLERGKDSLSAAHTIVEYLEKYGQGGSNEQFRDEYYNNSYLITDGKRALELYIIGDEYLLREVKRFDTISNSVARERDSEKADIGKSNNFSCKEDFLYTRLGRGFERSKFTTDSLDNESGSIGLGDVFKTLRHHDRDWTHPKLGSNGDICMHAGPLSRRFQTVNSMVVEIGEKRSIVWSTFSSNPCISLYKPVLFSEDRTSGLNYDQSYWLKSELIHRKYQESGSASYSDEMDSVNSEQNQIINTIGTIRRKWLSGESLGTGEYEEILDGIGEIDSEHLGKLQKAYGSVSSSSLVGPYGAWWKRKSESLT